MMFVFHTHEVRWFFSGMIPPEVAEWFAGRCDPVHQPERTDLYLTGVDASLGVKVREGRIEAKQRQGTEEVVHFGGEVEGVVQSWTKWGFGLADPAGPGLDGGWLPVTKRRWVRYYEVHEGGGLTPTAPGSYPDRGGGLELTEVSLPDGEVWWTVGVEVFGPDEHRRGDLLYLVEWLSAAPGCPTLLLGASLSYPAWVVGLKWGRN